MDKTILKQALKFNNSTPTYSQIEKLYKAAQSYQFENSVFLYKQNIGVKLRSLTKSFFLNFFQMQWLAMVS